VGTTEFTLPTERYRKTKKITTTQVKLYPPRGGHYKLNVDGAQGAVSHPLKTHWS